PLLLYLEALPNAIGISAIAVARAIGRGCGVALLFVIHRMGPPVVGRPATRVALALTAFYPPMALWAIGGLETLPTALAATGGVLLLATPGVDRPRALRAGIVLATLPWLRPEGIVIALAVAVLAEAPGLLRRTTRRTAFGHLVLAAGIPLASQLVLEVERLALYGHLMPNSVIYKSGAGTGWAVLDKFAAQATPLLVATAVGLVFARRRQLLLAAPPAVYALGSLGTLDSVNAFSRFFMPTWPQCALLVGLGVAVASRGLGRLRPAVAMAAGVAVVALIVTQRDGDFDTTRAWGDSYAACRDGARTDAAAWLRTQTIKSTTFAITDAGLAPAQARRSAIDQVMLNEPVIQRTGPLSDQRRAKIVFRRNPDVLVMASRTADRYRAYYVLDGEIAKDPRFRRYKLEHVARGAGEKCNYYLFLYQRAAQRPVIQLASQRARALDAR
ncbi:MAG: arabinofuranosyltransferase, partial [Thermoleophilaceae bacterium]|nr:arabinofuranosyltransferase [Thermoleophilaceae bacterium]